MPPFKQTNADDNVQENAEMAGSANLAETLEERGLVRGTWFLNGHEFRDFVARSPGEVVRLINAAQAKTGVTASVDDGYKLLLVANSPEEISVASGFGADQDRDKQMRLHRDANKSDGQKELDRKIEERDGEKSKHDDVDILELLGLEVTADLNRKRGGADWAPGPSAEDQRKRREDEAAGRAPESGENAPSDPRYKDLPKGNATDAFGGKNREPSGLTKGGAPQADPNASAKAIDPASHDATGTGGLPGADRGMAPGNTPARQGEAPGSSPATTESPSL